MLLAAGCSTFETLELPSEPAHMRQTSQEKLGLWIGAQLVADPLSIEHHFGPDLTRAGYLPVLVFLENRGETTFEVQRESFSVVLESGERFEPASPREVLLEVRRSTIPALVFAPLVLPAVYLYQAIEAHNFQVARTLHEKCLPSSLRLEKGDPPLTRAIFFRDPLRRSRPLASFDSSVLQVLVEIEGSKPAEPRDAAIPGTTADGGSGEVPAAARADPARRSPIVGELLTFVVSLTTEER